MTLLAQIKIALVKCKLELHDIADQIEIAAFDMMEAAPEQTEVLMVEIERLQGEFAAKYIEVQSAIKANDDYFIRIKS